jgi:hypothetical protein
MRGMNRGAETPPRFFIATLSHGFYRFVGEKFPSLFPSRLRFPVEPAAVPPCCGFVACTPEQLREWFREAGFTLIGRYECLDSFCFVVSKTVE